MNLPSLGALLCVLLLNQSNSGPEVGSKAAPFDAAVITGDRAGETSGVVAARGELPTVYVFVQADRWDRPMARFLRDLDKSLEAGVEGAAEARCVAIWLGDDPAKSKEYLPKAQQSLQFTRTDLAVFEGQPAGPDSWSISPEAHLTAVVVRGAKVIARFGHASVNETDVPAVIKAIRTGSK